MADDAQEIMLDHLRAIRGWQKKADTRFDKLEKQLNNVERQVAGLRGDVAVLQEFYVDHREDVKNLEERVSRIERRLDIGDALPSQH